MQEANGSTTSDKYKAPKWIPWALFVVVGVPLIIWAVMTPDPEKVAAESFLTAIEEQRYEAAFELLSENAKQQYGSAAALQSSLPLDEWITYNRDDSDRVSDAIDASARFSGGERRSMRIYLIQDGGDQWRIDRIAGLQ